MSLKLAAILFDPHLSDQILTVLTTVCGNLITAPQQLWPNATTDDLLKNTSLPDHVKAHV